MADILRSLIEEAKKRLQPVVKQVSSGVKQYNALAKQYKSPGSYLVSKIKPKLTTGAKELTRGLMTFPEAGKPETFLDKGLAGVGQAISMLPPVAMVAKTAQTASKADKSLKGGKIAYKIAPAIEKAAPKVQKLLLGAPRVLEGTKGAVKQAFRVVRRQKTPMPAFKIVQKAGEEAIALTKKSADLKKIPTIITKTGETKPLIGRGGLIAPKFNFTAWKDKVLPSFKRETILRNIEDIAPKKDISKFKSFLLDKIQDAELARVKFVNGLRNTFKTKVVDKMGIRIGSLEDQLIQRFGENQMTLKELKLATPKWREVQSATSMFRKQYDELLDMVNSVRKQYGYNPILKRKDYFTHFNELGNWIDNFGMFFKSEDLPAEISGITQFFKPGKPFTPYELARKGGKFTESAIQGFDKYVDSISRQIFHTDVVQRARLLEKTIRGLPESQHLSNFANYFSDYVNLLAGKKSSFDRIFESEIGRPVYATLNFLAKKTGANMVGGNVSSAVTNFIPLVQSASSTNKVAFTKGLFEGLLTPLTKSVTKIGGQESAFLTRRFPIKSIDLRTFNKITNKANWLFDTIDKFSARVVVAGKYFEKLSEGLNPKSAMKIADEFAAKAMAERTYGQLPTYFNIQTLRAFTQFQTEVNNYVSFIAKDIPRMAKNKTQIASMLTQLFVYSYAFNSLYEKATGRRPILDPIHIALQFSRKDRTFGENLNAAGKDLTDNLPFTSIYGGGRIPMTNILPTSKELSEAITSEKPVKELAKLGGKTALYTILPTGGGQIRKTITGANALYKGGVFTPSEMLKYPIAKDIGSTLQTILFGPYSGKGARFYFDNELKPLSEKETLVWQAAIKRGNEPYEAWSTIYRFKLANSLRNRMLIVVKDLRMTPEEKQGKLSDILSEYKILTQRLSQFSGLEDALATEGAVGQTPASPSLTTAPKVAPGQVLLKKGKSGRKPTLETRKLKAFKMKKAKYVITKKKIMPIYQIKPSEAKEVITI